MSPDKTELGALWEIVKALSDGRYHSGEEIGNILGVSRAAVWKHLQKLEGYGISLSSVKGRGYRIVGGLDLLDVKTIQSLLNNTHMFDVKVFPQLDSTNSFLMRQDNPAMRICLAEFQSAGRGRRGKEWVSPMAQNIYCSLGWAFEGGAAALEGLSLAIGVAIIRTLKMHGLSSPSLKWPNDVLYDNRKLAGILVEMVGDPAGYCQVVIGVGLNVSMSNAHGGQIGQPWVSLNEILSSEKNKSCVSRNQLVATLLNELIAMLQNFQQCGFAPYWEEWMTAASYLNSKVELRNGRLFIEGVFLGINTNGALRLLTQSGEQLFYGGEMSLRVAQ